MARSDDPDDFPRSDAPAIRVAVADDHPMWRDAVARDLADAGFEVVATADDGPSTVVRTIATRPDVLVLDLHLPGLTGPDVCAALTAAAVPTRVLILSASGEHRDVLAAVKAGAVGYLLKSAGRVEFLDAVRATAAGRAVFTPGLAGLVLGEFRRVRAGLAGRARPDVAELTKREAEILTYVATGMGYKEIAADLVISHRTVQNHVQNVLGKLHLHNRAELVRYALERGLVPGTAVRTPSPYAGGRADARGLSGIRPGRRRDAAAVRDADPGQGPDPSRLLLGGEHEHRHL